MLLELGTSPTASGVWTTVNITTENSTNVITSATRNATTKIGSTPINRKFTMSNLLSIIVGLYSLVLKPNWTHAYSWISALERGFKKNNLLFITSIMLSLKTPALHRSTHHISVFPADLNKLSNMVRYLSRPIVFALLFSLKAYICLDSL